MSETEAMSKRPMAPEVTLKRAKALVVLSGGQDSTTCAFWARMNYEEVHCITFDYGQRHSTEIEAAKTIAKLIGADSHTIVTLGSILKGTSPLTNPQEQLETYQNVAEMADIIGDRIEKTFVPMRNALFLTIAANHAACMGILEIVTGVCQEDNANYPDCRESFIERQGAAINYALGNDLIENRAGPWIWIRTPLMYLSKASTVEMAFEMSSFSAVAGHPTQRFAFAALAYSHTAYDGAYPPVGNDHASVLRASGFEAAGLPDPLILRAVSEGLMELPTTINYQDGLVNQDIWDMIGELPCVN